MLAKLRLEERELVAAGDAARPPEVDDHGPAAQGGEIERRAVEGHAGDARCRVAAGDEAGLGRGAGGARGDEHPTQLDQRERADRRDDETQDDEQPFPIQVERPDQPARDQPAYWTVRVPVIGSTPGWTEQKYSYVPAGSGW